MVALGHPAPGSRLGHWRLERLLGEGATAWVFAARHVDVARRAAVKVLHTERTLDPVARERFLREANAAGQVRHANIVPLFDAGIDDGVAYVVMDLIEGDTLAAHLTRHGPLAPERAVRITRDLAAGLASVHACGIVHRDIKPANVLLHPSGDDLVPVLVDFGAAWFADPASGGTLTLRGELIGTPAYMSPEQGAGLALDARADVYALGVLLYECLTGRRPYEGPTWQATLMAATRGGCPTVRSLRPEISAGLDRIVQRAMNPDRDARFPTADALRHALDQPLPQPAPRWGIPLTLLALLVVGVSSARGWSAPVRRAVVAPSPSPVTAALAPVPAPPHAAPPAPMPAALPAPTAAPVAASIAAPPPPPARAPTRRPRRPPVVLERGTGGTLILPRVTR
jgi:serine/threonine protein kinase